MNKMFCFQCEQTAKGSGCTQVGVCGKSADVSNLQDELTSLLIKLAHVCDKTDENTRLLINGLFTTITNVNFDDKSIKVMIESVITKSGEKDFDVQIIWDCDEDIRSLKSLILFGLKGIAAYAYHARILGYKDDDVDNFFYEALRVLSKN